MKTLLVVAALTLVTAGAALAEDTIVFHPSMGDVTFPHKMHQTMLKDCKICHTKEIGKIEGGMSKDFAHNTCKACHISKGQGPTKCMECHHKK